MSPHNNRMLTATANNMAHTETELQNNLRQMSCVIPFKFGLEKSFTAKIKYVNKNQGDSGEKD